MTTLILFDSKCGATKHCAHLVNEGIHNSTLLDIHNKLITLTDYDNIVIGSGVRMGKIYKSTKKYLRKNESILSQKKLFIFICNAYSDITQKIIDKNFSDKIKKSSICIKSFGGAQPFAKVTNGIDAHSWINDENIKDIIRMCNNHQKTKPNTEYN